MILGRHDSARLAFALLAFGILLPAHAQDNYPSRPVRLVAPYPPGGSSDVLARVIAQKLTDSLRRQVIVENRPGATGNIGHELVAKWTADVGAVPAALAVGATRKRADSPC